MRNNRHHVPESVPSHLWLCTSDTLERCAKDGLSMFAIDESKPIQSLADIYEGGSASAQIVLFESHNNYVR